MHRVFFARVPDIWDKFSGLYRCGGDEAPGWVRIHANSHITAMVRCGYSASAPPMALSVPTSNAPCKAGARDASKTRPPRWDWWSRQPDPSRGMAELTQPDFAKVGVTAEIVSHEWAEYLKTGKEKNRDGAMLMGWTGDNGDPDNFLAVLLGCDAPGDRGIHDAVSRHLRADLHRHAVRHRLRHSSGHHRCRPARYLDRPDAHGHRPIFWWGLLLIILFSGMLGWTPVSGRISLLYYFPSVTGLMLIDSLLSGEKGAFSSAVSHLILPTIVLGTIPLAVLARQTRSAMLEVLGEDYVRTARAKGMSNARVIGVHALRNALIPVVRTIGLQTGVLITRRHFHRDDFLLARH